jgi:hypothetical protein
LREGGNVVVVVVDVVMMVVGLHHLELAFARGR